MQKVITPVGSFSTLTVTSCAIPAAPRSPFTCYVKRDGKRLTSQDLTQFEYVRFITHEEHSQGMPERVATIPTRFLQNIYGQ